MENYEEEYRVGADSRKEWQKEMKEQFHKQNTREGRIKLQIEELSKVIEEGAWYGEMSSKVDELRQLEKALEQEKPKCVFISASPESIDKMYHYLKGDLLIAETEKDNFIGYGRIFVPKRTYEWALRNGRNYACSEKFGIDWVNYNGSRNPSAIMEMACAVLPDTLLPGEEMPNYSERYNWDLDKNTPPYLLEYLASMRKYVCNNGTIRAIKRECSGNYMHLMPYGIDYDEKRKLLEEFIEKYGYGPFETIYPLKYTGEKEETPFQLKKTK